MARGVAFILILAGMACAGPSDPLAEDSAQRKATVGLRGPYLGQPTPSAVPEIFAPGLVSTGMAERDLAMTPDGTEIYYTGVLGAGFDFSAILRVRQIEGVWTEPEVAPFSGRFKDLEPAISADGSRLFFVSYRPKQPGGDVPGADEDIFVVNREASGWSQPRRLAEPINSDQPEFFPSVTRDGSLYFTRRSEDRSEAIYRSRRIGGAWQPVEKLPPEVNAAPTQFNAFVDPDERYLIVSSWGREDSLGGVDYYIVFRNPDDTWVGPVNLGERINTATGQEWSPYVSPDGRYFFFMSSRTNLTERAALQPMTYVAMHTSHLEPMNGNSDIWWVDAGFLSALRPDPAADQEDS